MRTSSTARLTCQRSLSLQKGHYFVSGDWAGDFVDARKARLNDILEDIGTKKVVYLYDFGDCWEHTITIERIIDSERGVF
jgi:hypothetical protein